MSTYQLTNEETGSLCEGLALLLHAGVSAADGLHLLCDEESRPALKERLSQMADLVDGGTSLSAAFREADCLPDYVCGLAEVGERSGRLEESLSALARHYEDRARLDRRLRSALLYPAILLIIMLAVIVVLLVEVLPVFNDVYAQLGGQLTGVAGGLLSLGQALDRAMPVLCVLLGIIVVALALFAAVPAFREKVMSLWRRAMGDKGVSRKLNTARFAQALSMGMSSGLPLEEALDLTASLLRGTPAAEKRCRACLELLEKGEPLGKAVSQSEALPHSECRLLELGLRGGSGDQAMEQIARRLSEDSEIALEEKVGQVEPALVIAASVLVGLILLSVMLPLMNIMSAIG